MVKNLPAMQETWVQSLGWEDPLEEGMATHSSFLAWRIAMDKGAESDTTERLSTHQHCVSWRIKRPTIISIHFVLVLICFQIHLSFSFPPLSFFVSFSQLLFLWQSFPGCSLIKNLPAMPETQVQSLGQEDPLEKEMATRSSIVAWRIPWTEDRGAWWATIHGVAMSQIRLSTKQQQQILARSPSTFFPFLLKSDWVSFMRPLNMPSK